MHIVLDLSVGAIRSPKLDLVDAAVEPLRPVLSRADHEVLTEVQSCRNVRSLVIDIFTIDVKP